MDKLSEVCLHDSKELIKLIESAAYSPPLCIRAEPLCCLIFILLETNLRCKFTASLNVILPECCKHVFTPWYTFTLCHRRVGNYKRFHQMLPVMSMHAALQYVGTCTRTCEHQGETQRWKEG